MNQGLFLNEYEHGIESQILCLNPFESGSVFKLLTTEIGIILTCLNPFESGSVFKPCQLDDYEDEEDVLIPLNQGLFLNSGVQDFLFLSSVCKAAFQFFSCRQSCLIFSLLPYFLSSADMPMLRLLSAASMRHVLPDGLFVVVAAGFTGW